MTDGPKNPPLPPPPRISSLPPGATASRPTLKPAGTPSSVALGSRPAVPAQGSPFGAPGDGPRRPVVAPGENASQAIKDQICEMALGLLEEQVQARIVLYKADLETNPELDAITAEVVAQLREIQAAASVNSERVPHARDHVREAHEKLLRGLLERVFRPDGLSLLVEKRLKEMNRKLARLFFQSELHEKTRGNDGAMKVIQHGEQAIFYLLARYENRLKHELGGFDYASDETRERAFDQLAKISKEMQDAFLSRRSSELKRIVSVFQAVLMDFFCKQLAPRVGELAHEVITQAATFEGRAFTYKITADAFGRFRSTFERRLMVRLVGATEDQLLTRLADTAGADREEAVRFVTDPRVFSMILGELCDGLYEFFCNEGFLDLPPDWRQTSAAASAP